MPSILELADQLVTVEAAFARAKARGVGSDKLTFAEPKCPEGCAVCIFTCGIIYSSLQTARQDLADAMGQAAPALSHGGRFYVAAEGRA